MSSWPDTKKILQKEINFSHKTILDIGCGTGGMSFNLSEKVGQSGLVCGYDISQPMLEFAEKRRKERKRTYSRFYT